MMNQKVNSSKSSQAIQSTTFEADCFCIGCHGKSLSDNVKVTESNKKDNIILY